MESSQRMVSPRLLLFMGLTVARTIQPASSAPAEISIATTARISVAEGSSVQLTCYAVCQSYLEVDLPDLSGAPTVVVRSTTPFAM